MRSEPIGIHSTAGPRTGRLRRLSGDVLYNLGSLGFLAVAGLMLNLVIGRVYGAGILGIFSIVFAIYIFASQIGTAGIHYSVLRSVSLASNPEQARARAYSGLLLVALTSTLATLAAWLCLPLVRWIYPIAGLDMAYLLALPGLWCFSLNKVLLGIVNGLSHMRAFAMLQAARYVFILLILTVALMAKQPGEYITVTLTAAEMLLLVVLAGYVRICLGHWSAINDTRTWMVEHARFGARAMPSGLVTELNTRVDVLLLGSMLGEAQTGVYSMAVMLAEGLFQVVVVVRNVVNPSLSKIVAAHDQAALKSLFFGAGLGVLGLTGAGGLVLCLAYIYSYQWLLGDHFAAALPPLVVLVGAITVSSPFMAFSMILLQGGRPVTSSLFMTMVLVANVLFTFLGIKLAGIEGAAVGTGLSFVFAAALLLLVIKRSFGLRLV
jgi:O-antigen/teichoic acid export membrane protein